MDIKLTESQKKLLKRVAEMNGILSHEIIHYDSSQKGDNYLSQLMYITIKNKEKNLEVVLKKALKDPKYRNILNIRNVFLQEVYIYQNVLTQFATFQKQFDLDKPFESYAKCYLTSVEDNNECVVLQNLVKDGYRVWNRQHEMNSDHVALVMEEYAKLHAVSLAMRNKNPKMFQKLVGSWKNDFEDSNTDAFFKTTEDKLRKAVGGNAVFEKVLTKVMDNAKKYFSEDMCEPKEQTVILHGDPWCNNMLFKYEVSSFLL